MQSANSTMGLVFGTVIIQEEMNMKSQVEVTDTALAQTNEEDGLLVVADDVAYRRLYIVNVVFFGQQHAGDEEWVLIDAGLTGTAGTILKLAEDRFGVGSRPAAIILTHGHFDHVGAVLELANHWCVPVFAHDAELPFLDGRACYAPPDPTVGGGMMSTLSRFYPRGPIDVSPWLQRLPADGSVPGMPGWVWIHTPGHTPGHISLWRKEDRLLIAGDAVITTRQESAYAVLTQQTEIHGPPMYYTPDWEAAERSVKKLALLEPEIAVTGHGVALHGQELRTGLNQLAAGFHHIAIPRQGRYVNRPR